ncbi:mevalonate kinase [Archaeoglobales archaeon]|nr:MAG: mevalonate kinase [Archaeoglobales archaeon]
MKASAPAKIILFGEHAVVYKKHALVTAVNLRCYADVRKSSNFKIISPLGTTSLDFEVHPWISFAIKNFSKIKPIEGAEVKIESEIPIASGLGSSAAVTVSVLKALDAEFEAGLTNDDIYEIARQVEIDVQGMGSGTDPFISTLGGMWLVPKRERLKFKDFDILVVDTKEKSITSEMVRKVAELRDKYPDIINPIFDAIDGITLKAVKVLKSEIDKEVNKNELSELIFLNQCLLKAIGVSSIKIDEIVEKLKEKGIAAKLTGAGGGGCVIAIGNIQNVDLENSFIVKPEKEGVRIEQ